MNDNAVKNIVILGGGTAGWMTTSAIAKLMSPAGVSIRLIESEAIGTIGVGEATIPQISLFNELLEIDEDDFIKQTQATFKLGIEFVNWGKVGDSYIHPFGKYGVDMEGIHFHHFWKKLHDQKKVGRLGEYCLQVEAAKAEKFMRPVNVPNSLLSQIAYAFQFDAGLYAKYLRAYSENLGVKRTEGRVTDVKQDAESGFIQSLVMDDGTEIDGDLFIDCSGFFGLLIEKTLKTGYTDWSKWLPVNRAVAVACASPGDPLPYTRATARDAGWQWRIPLQHRLGNGYVFCEEYLSPEQAERDLLQSLEGKPLAEPKHLRFTTGHRNKFWVKNCVALGLSAGFMEPLESTSIHLVQSGLSRLMSLFPDKGFNQHDIDYFNQRTLNEYERVRDFLILHYKVTTREDTPFWNYVRTMDVPEKLTEKINLFKENGRVFREDNELFNETSWLAVMEGQNLVPRSYHPVVDVIPASEIEDRLEQIRGVVINSEKSMPTHMEFIKQNCAADPETPPSPKTRRVSVS